MDNSDDDRREKYQEFIDSGASLAGSAFGGVLGFMATDPVGAAVGAASGAAIGQYFDAALNEVIEWSLAPREQSRVSATLQIAALRIEARITNGDQLRSDSFIISDQSNRSGSREIAEGIFRVAQNEHEERKIPFIANLLANIAFSVDVDADYANVLVKTAQRISYRQMCMLLVLSEQMDTRIIKIEDANRINKIQSTSLEFDAAELELLRLVRMSDDDRLLLSSKINLLFVSITPVGQHLIDLMQLSKLDPMDLSRTRQLVLQVSDQYF